MSEDCVSVNDAGPEMTGKQHQLLINNRWRPSASGKTMEVVNPATEDVIAQVPSAAAADLDDAVKAARAALDGPWGKMSARERGRMVRKLGERLLEVVAVALCRGP